MSAKISRRWPPSTQIPRRRRIHLIDVEYEELPVGVRSAWSAMTAGGARAPSRLRALSRAEDQSADFEKRSDPSAKRARAISSVAFAESDEVFENSFRTQLVHQGYLEPYAITVEVDQQAALAPSGRPTSRFSNRRFWASTSTCRWK